jgi:hypothetical protein
VFIAGVGGGWVAEDDVPKPGATKEHEGKDLTYDKDKGWA